MKKCPLCKKVMYKTEDKRYSCKPCNIVASAEQMQTLEDIDRILEASEGRIAKMETMIAESIVDWDEALSKLPRREEL